MVTSWLRCIRDTWETTDPEWIGSVKATRFLGIEMLRADTGEWSLNQRELHPGSPEEKLGEGSAPVDEQASSDHQDSG